MTTFYFIITAKAIHAKEERVRRRKLFAEIFNMVAFSTNINFMDLRVATVILCLINILQKNII